MDPYGNFLLQLPSHHVFMDERGFFSKMMQNDKLKHEKDSRLEAFSKFYLKVILI